MTAIRFIGMSDLEANALRAGGLDIYGNKSEREISSGKSTPCRVCLKLIEKDAPYLLAAHRPFKGLNAYTETGPIYLHAEECGAQSTRSLPEVLPSPAYIVRGYSEDERIVGGTGGVTSREDIIDRATYLLKQPDIAFVDIRAADNNCWLARAIPADD